MLLDEGRHVAELILHGERPAVHHAAEHGHDEWQAQGGEQRPEGERWRDRCHHRDDHDGADRGVDEIHHRRPGHHAKREEIVGGTRHQFANRETLEERRRQVDQVSEEVVAEIGLDPARGAVEQVAHAEAREAADEGQCRHPERGGARAMPVGGAEGIHGALDEPRSQRGEQVRHQQAGETGGIRVGVAPKVRSKSSQRSHGAECSGDADNLHAGAGS